MAKGYAPEHLRTYRALIPMKNGEKMLQPGDIVEGTKEWDLGSLRACVNEKWIEPVPFEGEVVAQAPLPAPKADPWNGTPGATVQKAEAPQDEAATPKRRGRPPKERPAALDKAAPATGSAAVSGPQAAPAPASGGDTGRPALPGELPTEEERQAERLRVARIGVRAAGKADAKGRIDFTHEVPQIFGPVGPAGGEGVK